jgi:hypothetical protein
MTQQEYQGHEVNGQTAEKEMHGWYGKYAKINFQKDGKHQFSEVWPTFMSIISI